MADSLQLQISTIKKYIKETNNHFDKIDHDLRNLTERFELESRFLTENKELFASMKRTIEDHGAGIK